jgi:hypothetical protein
LSRSWERESKKEKRSEKRNDETIPSPKYIISLCTRIGSYKNARHSHHIAAALQHFKNIIIIASKRNKKKDSWRNVRFSFSELRNLNSIRSGGDPLIGVLKSPNWPTTAATTRKSCNGRR